MSRKGTYNGGSTVFGPGSDWYGHSEAPEKGQAGNKKKVRKEPSPEEVARQAERKRLKAERQAEQKKAIAKKRERTHERIESERIDPKRAAVAEEPVP